MRVGVATVYTPPIYGGAEFLADGLVRALGEAGHAVQQIRSPFYFAPLEATRQAMELWARQDFSRFAGGQLDALICLKFPTYLLDHPKKILWLLHQHRPAYDLFGTPFGLPAGDPEGVALRDTIRQADDDALSRAAAIYTIARRVSERLKDANGIASQPIYHPPADAAEFFSAPAMPYIFVPSRLETLKRQDLFLRAFARYGGPTKAILAGDGGMRPALERLIGELDLQDRVRLVGSVSRREMMAYYAHAQAVFFGPLDEDYGYITLEAMLAGKPVITCTDSGGPLEFVRHDETGLIVPPEPEAIAEAIAWLADDRPRAERMGRAGLDAYHAMGIGWPNVVETLLANGSPR